MADLQSFDKQDLINLQKVIDLDKKEDAAYQDADGTVHSMYKREEKGYRLHVKGSSDVYLFIFNKKNKHIATIINTIEPSQ